RHGLSGDVPARLRARVGAAAHPGRRTLGAQAATLRSRGSRVNEPPGFTLGPLAPSHRGRIARILRSTENFREEEVAVALDVFDESLAGDEYVFVGAFAREALVGFACYGPTMRTDRKIGRAS